MSGQGIPPLLHVPIVGSNDKAIINLNHVMAVAANAPDPSQSNVILVNGDILAVATRVDDLWEMITKAARS